MYSVTMSQMELFGEDTQQEHIQPDYCEVRVQRELHRIMGFLRFTPDQNGVHIARCAPDHFILPALAVHFTRRFGDTEWIIIDEKRGLCLHRESGSPARLKPYSGKGEINSDDSFDCYEELWKLYHSSVNIKERKNPRLQQQLIPNRYRKYLPEVKREK